MQRITAIEEGVWVPVRNPVKRANRLWKLLTIALKDLRRAERDPKVYVNMRLWLRQRTDRAQCAVCLAGAVMLYDLWGKPTPGEHVVPQHFEEAVRVKLTALDLLRQGIVVEAYTLLFSAKHPDPTTRSRRVVALLDSGLRRADQVQSQLINYCLATAYSPMDLVPRYTPQGRRAWWKAMRYLLKLLKEYDL